MAVVYATTLQNTRLDAVDTAVGTTGVLEIGTAAMAVTLVSINLNNPAFGAAAAGSIALDATALSGVAGATGTAAAAKVTDGAADVITGLTVGTAATDIILDNDSVNSGQTVTITSGTINHG